MRLSWHQRLGSESPWSRFVGSLGLGSILGGFWAAAAAEATGDTCVCKWFGEARPTALLWRGMKAVWRRDHNTAASEQLRNLSSRCLSQGPLAPPLICYMFFWNLKEIIWIIVLTKSRSYFGEACFLPNRCHMWKTQILLSFWLFLLKRLPQRILPVWGIYILTRQVLVLCFVLGNLDVNYFALSVIFQRWMYYQENVKLRMKLKQ